MLGASCSLSWMTAGLHDPFLHGQYEQTSKGSAMAWPPRLLSLYSMLAVVGWVKVYSAAEELAMHGTCGHFLSWDPRCGEATSCNVSEK